MVSFVVCYLFSLLAPAFAKDYSYPDYSYYFERIVSSQLSGKTQSEKTAILEGNKDLDGLWLPDPTLEDLAAVSRLPKLKRLSLQLHSLSTETLNELRKCPVLEKLNISTGFDDAHPLPRALNLPKVREITIRIIPSWILPEPTDYRRSFGLTQIQPQSIDCELIPHDPNIVELLVVGSSLKHGKALSSFNHLKYLCLNANNISADAFPTIGELKNLKEVGLFTTSEISRDQLNLVLANKTLERISIINPSSDNLESICTWDQPKQLVGRLQSGPNEPELIQAKKNESITITENRDGQGFSIATCLKFTPTLKRFAWHTGFLGPQDQIRFYLWAPLLNSLESLEEIDFAGQPLYVTPDNATWLSKLTRVKKIWICPPPEGAPERLKRLAPMQGITWLDLGQTDIAKDPTALLCFPNIRSLDLSYCELSPQLLTTLANLPNLTSLDLSESSLKDSDVKLLASLAELKNLNLSGTQLTDAALGVIGTFKNLESIDLSSTHVTGKGLAKLSGLRSLTTANFHGCKLSRLTDEFFSKCRNLKSLDLSNTSLTNLDLPKILKANLSNLNLSLNWISTNQIARLNNMPDLKELNTTGTATARSLKGRFVAPVKVISWDDPYTNTDLAALSSRKPGYAWKPHIYWIEKDWIHVIQSLRPLQQPHKVKTRMTHWCGTGAMMQHQEKVKDSYLRGTSYLGLQDYPNAFKSLNELVLNAPNSALAHAYRGLCLLKQKDYERAGCDLDFAIELDPKLSISYAYRAKLYQQIGQLQKSEQDMQKASQLGYNPSSAIIKP